MIDIFTYKILYFTVALLLGFLVGYFLKKDSYEEKIKDSVKNYERKYEETLQKLKLSKENLSESQTRLDINKDLLQTQVNIVNKLDNNILAVKQKNISLQNAKQEMEIKLDNIKNQIKIYEEKIDEIKQKYSDIENNLTKHNSLLIEYEKVTGNRDILLNKIDELSKKSNLLSVKIQNINKKGIDLDEKIFDIEKDLEDIKEKENLLKSKRLEKLNSSIEETRVKFLNYKYKYEELTNKISNNVKIDKEEIENFILKNEEERLVDKMLSKITTARNKK